MGAHLSIGRADQAIAETLAAMAEDLEPEPSNVPPPEGDVTTEWWPDPRRFETDRAYRDAVETFVYAHFPRRGPSLSSARAWIDDSGQRVLVAEVHADPDGNPYRDKLGRRTTKPAIDVLDPAEVLP